MLFSVNVCVDILSDFEVNVIYRDVANKRFLNVFLSISIFHWQLF